LGEDNFVGMTRIEETAHCLARRFIALRRLGREVMHPAMDIGVFVSRECRHRLKYGARFLRRSGVVEVNKWLAVNLSRKYIELSTDGERIKCRCCFRAQRQGHFAVSRCCESPPSMKRDTAACTFSGAIFATTSSRKARNSNSRASPSGIPR